MLRIRPPKQLRIAAALAAVAAGVPQTTQTSQGITPQQLAAGIKTYLRDSAEFPLHMDLVLVATDAAGRLRERKAGKGNYDFHGFNPRSNNSSAHLRVSNRSTMPVARNAVVAGILPSGPLLGLANGVTPVMSEDTAAELITATVPEGPGCEPFQWSSEDSTPERLCGSSAFQVRKNDLSLVRFTFQASGLPVATVVKPFGKCQLRAYLVEAEYQQVFLPGDPKPFLVPQRVEARVETDKGGLVMTSRFVPRK